MYSSMHEVKYNFDILFQYCEYKLYFSDIPVGLVIL